MPSSENSFPDRLSRGFSMHSAIANMAPPFSPTDPNIQPPAFESYLNGIDTANNDVSTSEANITDATNSRRTAAEEIQDKALRLKDHVGANINWKKYNESIITASKRVRGTHLPTRTKPVPTAPGDEPAPPKPVRIGAKSQQGFADIAKNFRKLIACISKITGYVAAPASGLSVAELTAQAVAYEAFNTAVTNAETDLMEKQRLRIDYYDGENGLRDKMKAIKLAVRSQYGTSSQNYAMVKGILV